jgi:hypothetical protein
MKIAGIVLLVIGIIGTIIFGLQAIGNSESFSFLGMDVAVSTANWTPVIVSGIILIVGIIMSVSAKRA